MDYHAQKLTQLRTKTNQLRRTLDYAMVYYLITVNNALLPVVTETYEL